MSESHCKKVDKPLLNCTEETLWIEDKMRIFFILLYLQIIATWCQQCIDLTWIQWFFFFTFFMRNLSGRSSLSQCIKLQFKRVLSRNSRMTYKQLKQRRTVANRSRNIFRFVILRLECASTKNMWSHAVHSNLYGCGLFNKYVESLRVVLMTFRQVNPSLF